MLMFTLGFLSGSYFSVFFVSLVVLSNCLIVEESFGVRLLESLLWPYHFIALMFGKDEEE